MMTLIVTAKLLGATLFCGFIALFLFPKILLRLFYVIPQTIIFAHRGELPWLTLRIPISELLLWVFSIVCAYALCYTVDPESLWLLTLSPTALICWVVGLIALARDIFSGDDTIRRTYYDTIYLANLLPEARKKYSRFIAYVDTLYADDAGVALRGGGYSYLERRALTERLDVAVPAWKHHIYAWYRM